ERRRVTLCRDIGGAMRGVSKHRGVPAPRAAEDISAALRDDGHAMNSPDQNGSTRREQTSDSTPHLKSPQQQQRQRQDCSWRSGRWPPFLERRRTRNSGAVFLLLLAGAFSLRGWRAAMMIDMGPLGVQPWTASPETDDPQLDDEERNQCSWEPNGPLMFNLHHSKQHADASHWFHVAECFIGRRSEFKEHFSGMSGTDVYVKDSNTSWSSRLSPMTRLLIAAGLSSVGVRDVHFVDGNHA
ncbi:unnamed protein product, partial [Ectocarpus fasciculatus]